MRTGAFRVMCGLVMGAGLACSAAGSSVPVPVEGGIEIGQASVMSHSPDGVWTRLDRLPTEHGRLIPWVRPDIGAVVSMDIPAMQAALAQAPMQRTAEAFERPLILDLPTPDGGYEAFEIVESPVMHPELQAKFPQIRTYRGQGIDNPNSNVRISMTPLGFDAQVISPDGWYYIDKASKNDTSTYTSYLKTDLRAQHDGWSCAAHEVQDAAEAAVRGAAQLEAQADDDQPVSQRGGALTVRTYRIAVATTGEYTQFFGGTVAQGQAAVAIAVNRMAGIYENDIQSSFELVPNNDLLIATNPATDNWPSGSPSSLGSIDSYIDSRIGSGSYDVGHLVDTGAGGFAQLGVVCTSSRGRGYTGLTPPTGDPFWVDYFSHEVGHQFGGSHTFNGVNGACFGGNRSGSNAYEPGSGSTIMGYAGICGGDNVSANSGAYFHWRSIDQMVAFTVNGSGRLCPATEILPNSAPVVFGGPNFTIPVRTPFELTANVVDPDGDPTTLVWEQADLGPARALGSADPGSGPLFRSVDPTASPSRMFPELSSVLSGTDNARERYPNTNRNLTFRAVARDNRSGGGGVGMDTVVLTARTSAGPFVVTSQQFPSTVNGGDSLTVNWDVASTNVSPVNTSTVTILWSSDNGQNFDTVLASGTPNDGSHSVTVPTGLTNQGRIRVQADGNVFFNINRGAITVEEVPVPTTIAFDPSNPTELEAGVAGTVRVLVDQGTFEILLPTAQLFTTIQPSGDSSSVSFTEVSPGVLEASLPVLDCGESVDYRMSLVLDDGSFLNLPEGGGTINAAVVCDDECLADVNGDGELNGLDFGAWLGAFNAGLPEADQNGDGMVNGIDFGAWLANFNAGCP